MYPVMRDRLIVVVGLLLAAAFVVTWEPVFGTLAFILLVAIAPWLDVGSTDG